MKSLRNTISVKNMVIFAMLSALALIIVMVVRIPVVMFLKYEPKDVIITIGGLIFGPLSAFIMSTVVSLIEMITISETGWIGCVMNILGTCSFACVATAIYKMKHNIKGAVIGLAFGVISMTAVMLLWNYFLVPLYTGMAREAVAEMLIPTFLPFNLIKGFLNASFTLLIYKPVINALRKQHLIPTPEKTNVVKSKINISVIILSCFVIITCTLFILIMQKII